MADTMQFINKLNGKYAGLKLLYSNRSRPWPASVQNAYLEADEFKDLEPIHAPGRHQPPGQSAAQIARTLAFQAKIDRPPGSDKKHTPAQTAKYQRRQAVMKIRAATLAGQPEGTSFCARCGKTGHPTLDCRTEHKFVDAFDEKVTEMSGVTKPQTWTGKPADARKKAKFTQDTKVLVMKNFEAEWSGDEEEASEGEAYDDMITDDSYCGVIRDRGQDSAYSSSSHQLTTGPFSKPTTGPFSKPSSKQKPHRAAHARLQALADVICYDNKAASKSHNRDDSDDGHASEFEWEGIDSDSVDESFQAGWSEWQHDGNQMTRGDPPAATKRRLNTATAGVTQRNVQHSEDDTHISYVIMEERQHTDNEDVVPVVIYRPSVMSLIRAKPLCVLGLDFSLE